MEKFLVLLFYIFIGKVESTDPEIVTQLIKEAEKIPKKRLDDAFYVRQNTEGDVLQYLHHKTPIFLTKNMEQKDQKVIVLGRKEDGLDDCGDKTTYVVLKLSDKSSSKYDVLYAYLRTKAKNDSRTIEWDSYVPRGSGAHNKAYIFGHEVCSRSIFTSCKFDKPEKSFQYLRNLNIRDKRDKKNDCFCDIINTVEEAQLSGTILTVLNMGVTILAGADLIYKDEMKLQRDIVQQLMSQQRKQLGRSFSPKSNALLQNITELAAGKFMEDGKQALSTGVLMFYVLLSSIGLLAEKLRHLEVKEDAGSEQFEEIRAEMRKRLGTKLLEELFQGNFDIRTNGTNPFPGLLLQVNIARQILYGGEVEDAEEEPKKQQGRRMTVRVTHQSQVNPQMALTANDNVKAALAVQPKEKTAGQLFAQNAKAGFYVPYGLIEKVGDVASTAIGLGKINNERTILDQGLETVVDFGTKTLGSVVDVAANVLKPFGLGPLSKIVGGIGGSVLGLAAGVASCAKVCEVMAVHQGLKIGAKLLGIGGLIGNKKKKKLPPPTDAQFAELYAQLQIMEAQPVVGVAVPPMVGVAVPPVVGVAVQPVGVGLAVGQAPPQGVAVQGGVGQEGMQVGVGVDQGGMQVGVGVGQGGIGAEGLQGGIGAGGLQGEIGAGGLQGGIGAGGLQAGIGDGGPQAGSGATQQVLPVDMDTELDIFTEWGWVSGQMTVQNLWMELKEPNMFIGFGTGLEKSVKDDDFNKIVTYENYVDYLILLFRIDNRKHLRKHIVYLVTNKYVSYDEKNKVFILQEKTLILTEKNLTPEEEIYLYLSFELVSFSTAYKSLVQSLLLLQCPSGEGLSKSVALIQLMTQEYISLTFTYGDVHLVKLIRNFGYTLKTMYTKSLQDVYRFNTCKKCTSKSISLVDNNAITLYGLMKWVLYGSSEYYIKSWANGPPDLNKLKTAAISDMYNAYFKVNRDEFITDVSVYIF